MQLCFLKTRSDLSTSLNGPCRALDVEVAQAAFGGQNFGFNKSHSRSSKTRKTVLRGVGALFRYFGTRKTV